MKTRKINFKKIISYLLTFTVLFTMVQLGNISKASADEEETQVTGMVLHIGDINGDEKIVDGNSSGGYVCEYLPMGESFTLEAETGYSITSVTSSNSKKMKISQTKKNAVWVVSSITDYSDFTLTVTITDSSGNAVPYLIEMKFESDPNLEFKTLQITYDNDDPINIDYTTTDDDGNYTDSPDSDVNQAKIKLLDNSGTEMTCTINGSSSNTVTLLGGENVITIKRTYLNISKEYTLIINKKGEAKLKSLVPSTGTLSPTFDSDTYDYEITVPTTQATIAFTPTSMDSASTIKIDGTIVKSGKRSANIELDEGENEIQIKVETEDGSKGIYNILVNRTERERSAQLSSLKLTKGTLSPAFNKGIYEYTATVDNNVTSVGITAVTVDSTATITIDGDEVPSGATSPNISLDEGANVINVKVKDDKGNTKTYVLTITRKYPKSNGNLSSLSVTNGTISPVFDPETYLYSVKVARSVEKVKVKFTAQNDKTTIKIDGKKFASGQQSDYIKLDLGANLVTVEVTAEDGKSTTTYKLSIIRGDVEGTNQWVLVAGEWTFYNGAGIQIKNQWIKYDNQWYFLDVNGYMQTGWIQESGNWYYLNNDGIMQTGWLYDKGYWYYFQGDGSMRVNIWAAYDGKWYYFNNLGELQTGWTLYGGKWYYMDEHGAMQKGWITYDKNKYYLNDDGTMKNGWLYNGKVWYYFNGEGKMVTGWQTINGKRYYFDANGIMKTGMMFLDGQWINLNNA